MRSFALRWLPAMVVPLIGACTSADVTGSDTPADPGDLVQTPATRPQFELTDMQNRFYWYAVNAHIYGSFRVGASGGGAITSGAANFPGAPKGGVGTCVNGTWVNAQGRATSGTLAKPHPHCVKPESAIEIVLEPISACYSGFSNLGNCPGQNGELVQERLVFGSSAVSYLLLGQHDATGAGAVTDFFGPNAGITAYAIDAATLGTTNHRVGTLSINFQQYPTVGADLFQNVDGGGTCVVGSASVAYPCLNKVITATYQPLPAPDGLGPSDAAVEGFLWMEPAGSAFNYLDDPDIGQLVVCQQQFVARYGPLPNIFDFSSLADANSWCQQHVIAADVLDCAYRLAIITGVLGDNGGDPCLALS